MKDNVTKIGEQAQSGHDFCPYSAVAKFPYKYIDKAHLQPVSEVHFAGGQFRARGWTLYYIHPYIDSSSKPLLLVPALEVEALLYDINNDFGTAYKMPRPKTEPGFLLNFDDKGSPRPRYLGRVNLDVSVEHMESKIPAPDMREDRSFAAFRAKMEAAIQATKNKSKSQKEKKKKERIVLKQSWCAQLKRAQCYLGVRPRRGSVAKNDPLSNGSLSWAEYQEAQKTYDISRSANLPDLDVTKAVPYLFDKNVVFVCVDVEAWEKDQSVITEIGVCTLDTNDLAKLPPGEGGKNWMTAIRPRHFRISEHQHLINQDFIAGCADRFEKDFGTSSFISINEAPQVVASCFREPFSASFRMKSSLDSGVSDSLLDALNEEIPYIKRNIVVVGHDIRSDIAYLRGIGYDVTNLPNLLEAIDTADMFKALKHEQQSRSLGGVLLELEMVGWNLHNAGNDAAYTLQAMIGVALAGLQDKQRRQIIANAESVRRMENAAQDAQDRIIEESEEWEAADVDGDGGIPVCLAYRSEENRHKYSKARGGSKKTEARVETKRAGTRAETSASASDVGKTWQENDLIDFGEHSSQNSKGLFIRNVATQDEVLNLFTPEDEESIVRVEKVKQGKTDWSVHFHTWEAAKAALNRQPADHTKAALAYGNKNPDQARKPYIKWLDEDRGQSRAPPTKARLGGGKAVKESAKPHSYVPVTEWGPPTQSPMTVKDLSERMKARMALLGSGDGDEGGVELS